MYSEKSQTLKRFHSWRKELTVNPPPTSPCQPSKATSSNNLWGRALSLGHLSHGCVTTFEDEWPGKRMRHTKVQTLPWTNNGSTRQPEGIFLFSFPSWCSVPKGQWLFHLLQRWEMKSPDWERLEPGHITTCFLRRNKTDKQTHRKGNSLHRAKN